MAERRMFAKTIVLSDAFLDMPLSARCLYFTLGMFADDDGFVNSPKGIMRQCGASEDDMKLLMIKKFLIGFDSGVIVIKHWRINNYLRGDRYHETKYIDEKDSLFIDENGAYSTTDILENVQLGIPSMGKPRLDKDSIDNIYMSENSDECVQQNGSKSNSEQLRTDFDIIYKSYPKKVGKTKAYSKYVAWVTKGRKVNGRNVKLTNKQIWDAIANYKRGMEAKETDLQFYKNFDTFMGDSILDYIVEGE